MNKSNKHWDGGSHHKPRHHHGSNPCVYPHVHVHEQSIKSSNKGQMKPALITRHTSWWPLHLPTHSKTRNIQALTIPTVVCTLSPALVVCKERNNSSSSSPVNTRLLWSGICKEISLLHVVEQTLLSNSQVLPVSSNSLAPAHTPSSLWLFFAHTPSDLRSSVLSQFAVSTVTLVVDPDLTGSGWCAAVLLELSPLADVSWELSSAISMESSSDSSSFASSSSSSLLWFSSVLSSVSPCKHQMYKWKTFVYKSVKSLKETTSATNCTTTNRSAGIWLINFSLFLVDYIMIIWFRLTIH